MRHAVLPAFVAAFGVAVLVAQEPTEGKMYALIVGVRDYKGTPLSNLKYTENDAAGLADALTAAGYARVVLMTRANGFAKQDDDLFPSADNIRLQLASLLKNRRSADTVVVAFSGHGGEPTSAKGMFFCPEKCALDKPATLVSLADVRQQLAACPARAKLLVVDACRNDPAAGKTATIEHMASVTRPELPKPPEGLVELFSCSAGQRAFESEKLKRGFLFHFVIEGYKGRATDSGGAVTLGKLSGYVVDEVEEAVKAEFGARFDQVPQVLGNIRGKVPLTRTVASDENPQDLSGDKFAHFGPDGARVLVTINDDKIKRFEAWVECR